LAIARDRLIAQGHDYSAARLPFQLLYKPFQLRTSYHLPTVRRYLVEVFRNNAPRFNQLIDRKGRLVGTHCEKIAAMNNGKIDAVESCLRRPITDQAGISGPKYAQAIREANNVTRFTSCVSS